MGNIHFHICITNNGVEAQLPATAAKEQAIETAVTWLGVRISAAGVTDLFVKGSTVHTAFGVASLKECECDDELLTREAVKKAHEEELEMRMEAASDAPSAKEPSSL